MPRTKANGSGLTARATRGMPSDERDGVDAVVPVVRHDTHREALAGDAVRPVAQLLAHLARVAREQRVVEVEQQPLHAEPAQVLEVDRLDVRVVAVGREQAHRRITPTPIPRA